MDFNRDRLEPATPDSHAFTAESAALLAHRTMLEADFLEQERAAIAAQAASAPRDPRAFLAWFEALEQHGPGQHDPLFDWLAEHATVEQMAWFVKQESAGEAGFDDLLALTQLRFPQQPKLEMARNYWDEMGRGHGHKMHGPMLDQLTLDLAPHQAPGEIVWESLALANVLVGLAANRRYAYHSIGALGAVELTAPGRCVLVTRGLERLGMSKVAVRYYRLHATVDVVHSRTWNAEVIEPLVTESPEVIPWIAEGALMRLAAGARCFATYRRELNVPEPVRA